MGIQTDPPTRIVTVCSLFIILRLKGVASFNLLFRVVRVDKLQTLIRSHCCVHTRDGSLLYDIVFSRMHSLWSNMH